jgi:hypothetical protein
LIYASGTRWHYQAGTESDESHIGRVLLLASLVTLAISWRARLRMKPSSEDGFYAAAALGLPLSTAFCALLRCGNMNLGQKGKISKPHCGGNVAESVSHSANPLSVNP